MPHEAPRSSFSQKKLFRVLFDGASQVSYHSEDELLVIVEAQEVFARGKDERPAGLRRGSEERRS